MEDLEPVDKDHADKKAVMHALVSHECLRIERWINERCENKLWHGRPSSVNNRLWILVGGEDQAFTTFTGYIGGIGLSLWFQEESLGEVYVYGRKAESTEQGAYRRNGIWVLTTRLTFTISRRLDPKPKLPILKKHWENVIEQELMRLKSMVDSPGH